MSELWTQNADGGNIQLDNNTIERYGPGFIIMLTRKALIVHCVTSPTLCAALRFFLLLHTAAQRKKGFGLAAYMTLNFA